jgi:aconitate hydratase
MPSSSNPLGTLVTVETAEGPVACHRLAALESQGLVAVSRLPYSVRVLLESVVRHADGSAASGEALQRFAAYDPAHVVPAEVPFYPARVILQDFTGVPAVVDLAALRSAVAEAGGDPRRINPRLPVDLVIDHSVQVDAYGSADALGRNLELEFARNRERYAFLRWGQRAFDNLRIVPPGSGIVHQVNLERLAAVVATRTVDGVTLAFPDSLVGTDSHTTMINGLGVLGWGVGGIEAEAVMLGAPLDLLLPEVIGVRLSGRLPAGATATDLVLRVTEVLRKHGVVNKFVEFFGPGLASLGLPDRATLANMAPEYGATVGFFPVDGVTLDYLRATARPAALVDRVERISRETGLFRVDGAPDPTYTAVVELDLNAIEPALAGPRRPQDRVPLGAVKAAWRKAATDPVEKGGYGLSAQALEARVPVEVAGRGAGRLGHGAVSIAAITSCTNTSNPSVLLAAGLVAKRAVQKGLTVPPWVKTSLAPGSRAVTDYLSRAGLTPYLDALGFQTVGYGCTTCIGNSGPLPDEVAAVIDANGLAVASVLSGNRNFSGRVHAQVKANWLASPPLVVAYALAGTVDLDLTTEPLGVDREGQPVFLTDLWPAPAEIEALLAVATRPETYARAYETVELGPAEWNAIPAADGDVYPWDAASTYIQRPPFVDGTPPSPSPLQALSGARVLFFGGDSVTTDHISPAGSIKKDGPAGRYLVERGVPPAEFNSYGARRGNDRVMVRGTLANTRLQNRLAGGREGGVTLHQPSGDLMSIYDAAVRYAAEGVPLVILAGLDYGMGSSRDWAAKGTWMLGVKAVLAESFERIHRSNLAEMGVLPLQFLPGQGPDSLGLTGTETFAVALPDDVVPRQTIGVTATRADGSTLAFEVTCRLDTPFDLEVFRHGGILRKVLREALAS